MKSALSPYPIPSGQGERDFSREKNYALLFDGKSSYVEIEDSSEFELGNEFTIAGMEYRFDGWIDRRNVGLLFYTNYLISV